MKMFFCKLSDCFFYNYKYEQSYKNISSNRNTTLSITISRLIPQYRKLDFRNKILFYQIIHQNDEPKSYVWFYNILEDFNFGTIHYFWNNVWLEIILKSNIIQDKAHLQQKILSANFVKMSVEMDKKISGLWYEYISAFEFYKLLFVRSLVKLI